MQPRTSGISTVVGFEGFDLAEVGFEDVYDLFKVVTEVLGQKAIVIDNKDLLEHPGK